MKTSMSPIALEPLRVVHVTFGLDIGGLECMLREIGEQTDPKRVQLFFVSLGATGPIGADLRRMGWPVVSLHRPAGFRPSLLFSLARLFHGVRAKAVHTHDARALIYGAPAARLARVKRVVHTQHGQNLHLSPRQLRLLQFAAKRTDHYVCVSRDAMRIASQQKIAPDRLATICNGIDVERLKRRAASLPACQEPGPLMTVSRLSPEKDISTLLKAVSLVKKQLPDIRLEIAGDGPSLTVLGKEVQQLQLEGEVRFLGFVNGSTEVLNRARIFVLPSTSEGLSLTLLEAMAVGVPAIATNVGGNPEIIEDGETGILVPPGDPKSLANAICKLWNNVEERRRLAEAAQIFVSHSFCVARMLEQYEQLYFGFSRPQIESESFRQNVAHSTVTS